MMDDILRGKLVVNIKEQLRIFQELGYLDLSDENFKGTPERVAKAWEEIFEDQSLFNVKLKNVLKATFPSSGYDEIVAVKKIKVFSVCPHHFLPVEADCTVAYIPNKKVLGLSKLVRLVKLMASQPILQEKMTFDITNTLMEHLRPKGAATFIQARHFCMLMRGVRQEDAITITSSLKGVFMKNPPTRAEFFELTK